MDNQKTGDLIAQRRRELGLTQQQLAERLGVTNKAVSKWERGDGYPDIALIAPLSEALGLSADELLRGERVPAAETPPMGELCEGSGGVPPLSADTEVFTREFLPVEKTAADDSLERKRVFAGFFIREDGRLRPTKWVGIAAGALLALIAAAILCLLLPVPPGREPAPSHDAGLGTVPSTSASDTTTAETPTTTTTTTATTTARPTTSTTTTAATTGTTLPPRPVLPNGAPGESLTAPEVLLFDLSAGRSLYSYHSGERRDPASLTKLMTAIVALEQVDADAAHYVVGSEQDMVRKPESSLAYLQQGWDMPVSALVHAMLLPSGCDAAYTLAAGVGRDIGGHNLSDREAVDVFIRRMNETAARIGASSTFFADPDGFSGENLSTADDLLLIARYAMQKPLIRETASKVTLRDTFYLADGVTKKDITWDRNTNLMIDSGSEVYYPGANGLKTGSSDSAGFCLIVTAKRDGRELMAIVLGAPRNQDRWADAAALLDAGFAS